VAAKDRELSEMKAAVESAKETILQQNEHIGSQDDSLRKARRKAAETHEDAKSQLQSLQEENIKLKNLVERYYIISEYMMLSALECPLLICNLPYLFFPVGSASTRVCWNSIEQDSSHKALANILTADGLAQAAREAATER
jgi:hypothetical protein